VTVAGIALWSTAMVAHTQKVMTPEELDRVMKKKQPAMQAIQKALAAGAYAEARTQLDTLRQAVLESQRFWIEHKRDDALKMNRDTIAKIDNFQKVIATESVDPAAATTALKEIGGSCRSCHQAYRATDSESNYIIKPGSLEGPAGAGGAATSAPATAQKTTQVHPGKGGSPHVRTESTIDGAHISIEYGRPFLKGRDLKEVAPPGREWRTGADEATTLTTDRALRFGTLNVPAGTYTLYTVPGETEWQLVVSKKTGQWGIPYPKGEDLGRVPMTVGKTSAPVEQLTISVADTAAGGTLRIDWGTTSATVPFTVGS
jgi:cytochrome c556